MERKEADGKKGQRLPTGAKLLYAANDCKDEHTQVCTAIFVRTLHWHALSPDSLTLN